MFGKIGEYLSNYGTKLLFVLCILVIGCVLIWLIGFLLKKILLKTKLDGATLSFCISIFKVLLFALLIVVCAAVLELSTSSLIVSLSTFAVAVGLALKDSFSNLANGILIICNHPFKRGDHISVAGVEGKVQSIKLLTVELITFDNVKVVLPNSSVLNNSLYNYTALNIRRITEKFGVAYGTDLDKAQELLKQAYLDNPLVLKSMGVTIFVSEYAASEIIFTVRCWVNNGDYWTVFYEMPRIGHDALMNNGIQIAFNQLDVHVDYVNKDKE